MYLNEYNYNEPMDFWSVTEQVSYHMDKNTNAITAQTEQQKVDSELLRETIDKQTEQQAKDASTNRTLFDTWMNNLVTTFKKIFGKDTSDNETSYFEMMENEQKRMQAYISAHTETVKENGDNLTQQLEAMLNKLTEVDKSIDANTSGDALNAKGIKDAIANLRLEVNNYIRP